MSLLTAHQMLYAAIRRQTDATALALRYACEDVTLENTHTLARLAETLKREGFTVQPTVSLEPTPRYTLWLHPGEWQAAQDTIRCYGFEPVQASGIQPYLQRPDPPMQIRIAWHEEH
ncbi:hypothetical protein EV683_12729 [Crenobacter luteus]|uniref:hypothetical protein n=1 Tax=Crenobacter luteus TaxID=1452487 RepID=UPI001049BA5B|nr:hypothetical protein [Crenobacter luteus]TCP09426.1 hypothetical protein EV683_12729 [Crenobacter luteus]